MVCVKWNIIIFITVAIISNLEGRKLYDDSRNDEDDSLDCNDGKKIDDPVLLPFFEKLREQEMIPSEMEEWIIFFDENESEDLGSFGEDWSHLFLTENGLSKDSQGMPFGRVFNSRGKNVYLPRLRPISEEWQEFRVMYAEQLLLDAIRKIKIYIKLDPTQKHPSSLSESATRMLKKLMKRSDLKKIYVVSRVCGKKCRKGREGLLLNLVTCGEIFGKTVKVECIKPRGDIFKGSEAARYKDINEPEFQVELPNNLKQDLHNTMDWLLSRIAQRMKNYMEMAFAKNRFRKTPTDIYDKVNLQISKIRGGQTFEASKSADLIYKSLFDLNVYLNVTNTPYTFDKFASFNRYLNFIGRFSKWQLDTTKYANFFEPLKEICLQYIGSGPILMKPATKIFELEEGVYDLTGAICHENVLYIVNGLTNMNTIKSGIYDHEGCRFDTVFVLAKKNFTINENLKIPGKNLVIFSPLWIIVKQQSIDLSGNEGKIGEKGAAGGDFFAFGTKFDRSEFLTVVSRGGDGGRGRDAEDVFDPNFFEMDGKNCVPRETKKLIKKYGATYGAQGGSPGKITLKFIRNPVLNVSIIREEGKNGKNAVLKNITVKCNFNSRAVVPVGGLEKVNFTTNPLEKITESEVLELFRKMIRKNSRRLSYEVLSFYKDIWTSPVMGQTLDSTLTHFLNSSDYTKDSREFYDITSQILHAQIKHSCNITEQQRILLDFALVTIRMESPMEGVLPSIIDIQSYLKEVSNRVGRSEITSEYFERKEAKFLKVIEEANNYLNASLLPSLRETIDRRHEYLEQCCTSGTGTQSEEHFQETLIKNNLLRHLTTLFEHVHLSLNEFVSPPEENNVEELNSEGLKRKLYFYRHVRNNMTVNQMNAMQEFLKLLKAGAGEALSGGNPCFYIRQKINKMLKALRSWRPKNDECERIANALENDKENGKLPEFGVLSCRVCAGNCELCGWCRSCQMRCLFCQNCNECPWCLKCLDPRPEVPAIGSECSECNSCDMCPTCIKCDEDPNQICNACQSCHLCPECPHCISAQDCRNCRNCAICPHCPRCHLAHEETSCLLCTNCAACPECSDCQIVAHVRDRRFFSGAYLCQFCPCFVCRSCPGCQLRPEFDEIDRDVFFNLNSYRSTQPVNSMNVFSRRFHLSPEEERMMERERPLPGYVREGWSPSLPPSVRHENPARIIETERKEFHGRNRNRGPLPDNRAAWLKCLIRVGSRLDQLFQERKSTCNAKMQSVFSATLESLRQMMGSLGDDEVAVPKKKMIIPTKCTYYNETLDVFSEKLSSEVKKCKDSDYDYRESESICSAPERILFQVSGCDPETFSRTYDEIRYNFLKEFSPSVGTEEVHSDELDRIPRNFMYLLTNMELFLSEGINLTETNINEILRVTEPLLKFRDLRRDYEKKVAELHDFSETDVYDLYTAELRMQNERLDLTSRWLSQLKKLMPWIKKAAAFLGTDIYQEVNEKILEAVRLVSEIVHNVKVVEHYRDLRNYMNIVKTMDNNAMAQGISKFQPVFERTFITDVFNKAVKISENWMFPLTKSLTELRSTLLDMKNSTYSTQLNAVAKEIENHRKAISLYTSTQFSDSKENKTLFYKWNIRTRPTLLDDLFKGKPVILVSEILDGGKMNSLMAKNFEMRLVAGSRQNQDAQQEIDAALVGTWLNVTHSGISYFKFGSRIYRRLTETFTFRQAASPLKGSQTASNMDFVLSPYTTWIVRMKSDAAGEFPIRIKNKIGRIDLYGSGRYVVNCADIPDVNQNFAPLTDYRRRNEK